MKYGFITKWVSKNVQYSFENICFSNTPTFALIMLCHRSIMLRNENPDALASHNCTEDHSIVVIGVAFSLIVIMLQAKTSVRVHSLIVSNII